MTNARKAREKHRMEKLNAEEQAFEQERIRVMVEANQVYECSGTQTHNHDCEGCEVRVLKDDEIAINEEMMRWQELGMTPIGSLYQLRQVPGVPVDTLKLEVALAALTQMCYKLGMDEEELNIKFREMFLDRLTAIREANEEAILEARRRQAIAVPGADILPQIMVPDYIKQRKH